MSEPRPVSAIARPDPRVAGPAGQQGPGDIDHPGLTTELHPRPDHGEASYVGSGRLSGRRALITGGDSGIGRAVAIAFAREGADVAITYLAPESADAADTVAEVEAAGRRATSFECELTDEGTCCALVEATVDRLGGLDILVNNAAHQMSLDDGLRSLSSEQLVRTFTTNVFAMFWLSKAALAHLQPGASIINVASIQAREPSPQLIDYACTKAAIVNFTTNLAQQLADDGIRVNAVAPGPIWTPLIPATMPADRIADFGSDTPMGRAGQPGELAPAFVFLASPEASYVTGETIAVTGGRAFS